MESLEARIEQACDQLCAWHNEGRKMPGYIINHGKPYMSLLLGITDKLKPALDSTDYYKLFIAEYDAGKFNLADQIIGPHGWALLQAHIHKAEKRIAQAIKSHSREETRRKKRRLYNNLQREEAQYETDTSLQKP